MINKVKGITGLLICFISIIACSDDIKTNKNLIGLEEHDLIVKLSNPNAKTIIRLTKNSNLSEYRSNLYKLYPDLKKGDTIQVKELLWTRDENTEVIWLKLKGNKWVVVDHLKWSKDINF